MEQAVVIPSQVSLVAQILKLTQEDKIHWELGGPESIGDGYSSDRVDSVFLADYKGTKLKLVNIANKNYLADLASTINSQMAPRSYKEPVYFKANVLELLDERGNVVWRFPQLDILADLERAVRYQVANIKGFIDNIFAEV